MSADHPYWVEDNDFDLEFHVRHIALPAPGNWRQLCILVSRLNSRPIDLTRPLWEMYIVEGLDNVKGIPKGSFAVVSKIHHAAIDGVAGAEMITAIHDLEPYPKNVQYVDNWNGERLPGNMELMVRTFLNNVRQPFRFAKVVRQTVKPILEARQALKRNEIETAGTAPKTRFNKNVSPHRVFDGINLNLKDVKAIKSRIDGATINDAILAICGGGLRKYLTDKDELPEESLIAFAPISIRAQQDKSGDAGNQIGGMMVAIRTDIADPLDRLKAVHVSTQNSKALTNAIGASTLSDYSEFMPSTLSGLAARLYSRLGVANRVNPMFNIAISNVPGPQAPLYAYGARMVMNYGLGPINEGMGMIMPIFSYCGQITVSFSACRDMMPDPEFYAQCLQESFDELYDQATSGTKKALDKKTSALKARVRRPRKAKSVPKEK